MLYCDGVLLTNAQCHMVTISIPWHREYWTMQLKAHLKPDSIKSSNTPAWPHMYVSQQEFILISKNAAMMCGMYIINGVHVIYYNIFFVRFDTSWYKNPICKLTNCGVWRSWYSFSLALTFYIGNTVPAPESEGQNMTQDLNDRSQSWS